jgi:hypothetical protein
MADAPVSLDAIYRLAAVLDRVGVPFVFIGGVALNAWAIPRATFDMDLALSLEGFRLEELFAELERDAFVVDPAFSRGFRDRVGGMEKIHVHLPTGSTLLAVDLFLAGTPFLRSVLARRRTVDLGRGPLVLGGRSRPLQAVGGSDQGSGRSGEPGCGAGNPRALLPGRMGQGAGDQGQAGSVVRLVG